MTKRADGRALVIFAASSRGDRALVTSRWVAEQHVAMNDPGWTVRALVDEQATRASLDREHENPAAGYAFFCHGRPEDPSLVGSDGEPALDKDNLARYASAWIHAFACQSRALEPMAVAAGVRLFASYEKDLMVGWDPDELPAKHRALFAELCTEATRQLMAGAGDEKAVKRALQGIADRLDRVCKRLPPRTFMFQATVQQLIRDLKLAAPASHLD